MKKVQPVWNFVCESFAENEITWFEVEMNKLKNSNTAKESLMNLSLDSHKQISNYGARYTNQRLAVTFVNFLFGNILIL